MSGTGQASPELRAAQVADVFERIHRDQMAGLPLLNNALSVATFGFRSHEGRVLGMVVTPWMMSLMLLPSADDDWRALPLGGKEKHQFPGATLQFLVNVIDGLGVCQMYSVQSPMHTYADQTTALAAADAFLEKLLAVQSQAEPVDPVDEQLLGRILRGEAVPEVEVAVAGMPATTPTATG